MEVALLGFGRAGKIHYKNILENNQLNLSYIFDKNIENIPESAKYKITNDINIVLNDINVNLVVICTPTNLHYEFTKLCLKSKKHVLCEKPLSHNENEILECYNLAKINNCVLLCALNRRFDPQIINLKNNISQQTVGKIHQIMTISRDFPYPSYDYLKISSGIFHDCVVHDIDFLNWLLNDIPKYVYVTGNIVKSSELNDGNLDNAIIIMEYKDGTLATINSSRISNNYDQRIEVYGEYGTLKTYNPYHSDITPISFPERYKESYVNELNHIIDVINGKSELLVKEIDCINGLKIVEACQRSFDLSKKIEIKYNNFRKYDDSISNAIRITYKKARMNQTFEYVNKMKNKYLKFNRKLTFNEIFKHLEKFVDISDPDITLPNYYHGVQTAEGIRKDGHPDWLQLIGLIHDIGKIIYLWGCDEDGTSLKEQWGIVGDTFIVGCKITNKIVYPEFNMLNPDMKNPKYNTKLGIYQQNCGLDNVNCSWGHDEYLYQILKNNKNSLPEEALYVIRYHSLYSYHDRAAYQYFSNEHDKNMFKWLKIFNKYDLYTKCEQKINENEVKSYYESLIKKYFINDYLML